MKIIRTNSENQDFIDLVKDLDCYLALKDVEEHDFYAQFNKINHLEKCIIVYENEEAVGCGAIKPYDNHSMEVKRMFVKPEFRGQGFASKILSELELWAKEKDYTSTILETGKRQTEAVRLYSKTYEKISNYGQYDAVDNSVCFKKNLCN